MDANGRIQIGVVGRPHGVRGAFHLDGCIDAPALVPGLALEIASSRFLVAGRGGVDARPIVTLEEISTRDAVSELRGNAVLVSRADLTPLAEGEWYAEDLVDRPVETSDGKQLGRVRRLSNMPSVDVLEVGADDDTLLIPMLKDAIVSIDPDTKIVVDAEFLDLT